MKRNFLRLSGLVGVAALAVFLIFPIWPRHKLIVKAYFTNAMSLRKGAPVRLAGVNIGSVQSVRARPEMKESPAELVMAVSPGYDLRIPIDSTVSLVTAGVLGETFVEIDSSASSGPPVESNAILKAGSTAQLTTEQMIEKFGEVMKKRCDCDSKKPTLKP